MDCQKSLACQHTSRYMAFATPWCAFVEFFQASYFILHHSHFILYRSPLPQKEETCKNSDVPHARTTTRTLLAVKNRFELLAVKHVPLPPPQILRCSSRIFGGG